MPDTTSRYALPFQLPADAPDGPNLGEDLALAVEAALGTVEDTLDAGYSFMRRIIYTAGATYSKSADVTAGARKLLVRCQGGGGAGGGVGATAASTTSAGGGGQGGAYAESWLDLSAVSASTTVTVGAAGVGASNANGGAGGTSSFGSLVSAAGGAGGINGGAGAGTLFCFPGGSGAQSITGDLQVPGSDGGYGLRLGTVVGQRAGGVGGPSVLGSGGIGGQNAAGVAGKGYGGGGGGATRDPSSAATNGGNGAPGVVIVDVYR